MEKIWCCSNTPKATASQWNYYSKRCIGRGTGRGGYFARWTTNFDSSNKCEWWWCLKDDEVYLDKLSSKQRYRINKGQKNIEIVRVSGDDAKLFAEDLYELAIKKLEEYPKKYRPVVNKKAYVDSVINNADKQDYWICRDKESGVVCGYAKCMFVEDTISLAGVKVLEPFMNKEVNAVLIYRICEYYLNHQHKRYVCDGERSIVHETSYQEYLCRVLNFRYAYCDLHVVYKPIVGLCVKVLYPFKTIIKKFSNKSRLLYNVYCTLEQEKIAREFR